MINYCDRNNCVNDKFEWFPLSRIGDRRLPGLATITRRPLISRPGTAKRYLKQWEISKMRLHKNENKLLLYRLWEKSSSRDKSSLKTKYKGENSYKIKFHSYASPSFETVARDGGCSFCVPSAKFNSVTPHRSLDPFETPSQAVRPQIPPRRKNRNGHFILLASKINICNSSVYDLRPPGFACPPQVITTRGVKFHFTLELQKVLFWFA